MIIATRAKAALLAATVAAAIAASAFAPARENNQVGARRLTSASFTYRLAGDFSRNGKPVAGPLRELRLPTDLVIMEHLVTAADYAVCMNAGGCPRIPLTAGARDVPVVGVSWQDASAYAAWISHKTGVTYRLPTDEEWTFAAAEKARDEVLPLVDPTDPAQAWIARYEAEAAQSRPKETTPQPTGTFGTNSKGLQDVAGNVWEWTQSCFIRASLGSGTELITNTNCGVRVVEGAHRTYMTDFIRDPKAGGCALGVPPTNLGFRLVIEPDRSPAATILNNVAKLLRRS